MQRHAVQDENANAGNRSAEELSKQVSVLASDPSSQSQRSKVMEVEHLIIQGFAGISWHRHSLEEIQRQATDAGCVRVLLNGCFDVMHHGHFNALRQAKQLFYQKGFRRVVLVACLHSDETISQQKGPPLMNDIERLACLKA
eukprot:627075-Amphidinium_carterae.1